jgi:hypothetical protein
MQQSPSRKANRFSISQEIPLILRNPKNYYYIYKSPKIVPILSQINPVKAPIPILEDLFGIILAPTPKHSLCLRFPHQNPVCLSLQYYHCS